VSRRQYGHVQAMPRFLHTTILLEHSDFHRGTADKIRGDYKSEDGGPAARRLYDALSTAVGLLRDRPAHPPRVIIVVAEGRDSGSEEKLGAGLREFSDFQTSSSTLWGFHNSGPRCAHSPRSRAPIQQRPLAVRAHDDSRPRRRTPTASTQRDR